MPSSQPQNSTISGPPMVVTRAEASQRGLLRGLKIMAWLPRARQEMMCQGRQLVRAPESHWIPNHCNIITSLPIIAIDGMLLSLFLFFFYLNEEYVLYKGVSSPTPLEAPHYFIMPPHPIWQK